jgi:uncharacterized membrane protein YdbT with pleckstrin-like domain
MFRAHPFWFILCLLLTAAFGIGMIILLYWFLKTRATALTVIDSELTYELGILSKERTSMSLKHVRSVSIVQGFVNRILGVGTIQIYTAGDEPEFTIVRHARSACDPGGDHECTGNAQRQGLNAMTGLVSTSCIGIERATLRKKD